MDEAERQSRFREVDEANTARRAGVLGAHYRDMREEENTIPLVEGIMEISDMYKYRMVPLAEGDYEHPGLYGITLSTPESHVKEIRETAEQNAQHVNFDLISDSAFRTMMRRYDPPKEVHYGNVEITGDDESEERQTTIASMSEALGEVRSADMLDYLIFQADRLGASDIHLENQREEVRVRFRIDGTLHEIADMNHDKYRELFFAIASVANLSTAATEAQSGHIVRELVATDATKFGNQMDEDYQDHTLNMRIETVPTSYGQDAVIRLFNFNADMLNMELLGLSDDEMEKLEDIVSHPRGMVLVVGPTGSGKSTTLYSILSALNDPTRKLLTLEDPIEFDISGVTQIPIDTTHGQSFADNVRTILRLDPDVVMVGEIRDEDTARTAIQAAITGHLLLATFHAQDAAAAFARMIDMIGVNPVFATAIRLVIGQRLVRRLDNQTKIEYHPDEATKEWIRGVLKGLPENVEKPDLENFSLWKPGSSEENPFGYHGRLVLMEQLVVNDEIAGFLRGDEKDVSAGVIEKVAREQGMVTMLQKGVLKALAGETTLEEVNRVL
ncbi:MAG: Flp pilus assembly complex ATPase component TadA [Candidatus Nomurabacteria bacterium]|jgi:type II secretory ATPase GspE/PulE/Tfp pilus assembly ATPase PilB-like protein|nr:Flp pilus assembly complex ATPase component TadA [Candidatus Nomurabacteria bacterium]